MGLEESTAPTPTDGPVDGFWQPWWAYGPAGMQLWFPSLLLGPSSVGLRAGGTLRLGGRPLPQDPELEFDREARSVCSCLRMSMTRHEQVQQRSITLHVLVLCARLQLLRTSEAQMTDKMKLKFAFRSIAAKGDQDRHLFKYIERDPYERLTQNG